jgi:hypothetical protein
MRLAKLLHDNLVSEEAALNRPIRRLPFAKRKRVVPHGVV